MIGRKHYASLLFLFTILSFSANGSEIGNDEERAVHMQVCFLIFSDTELKGIVYAADIERFNRANELFQNKLKVKYNDDDFNKLLMGAAFDAESNFDSRPDISKRTKLIASCRNLIDFMLR